MKEVTRTAHISKQNVKDNNLTTEGTSASSERKRKITYDTSMWLQTSSLSLMTKFEHHFMYVC